MLDRTMIDIAKWIVIILIFFLAFACSLFLIFSYFSVVLQQTNLLSGSNSLVADSTSTSTTITNAKCPDYFYVLLNETISIIPDTTDQTNTSTEDFCEQTSNYDVLTRVGPYPGIYYFGRSFEATLLTTFFTLFGVIGENGVPVSVYKQKEYLNYRSIFFDRTVDMN